MLHKYLTIISVLLLLSATAEPLRAQSGASLGMGGAYTSLARGTEAAYWNPANLGYERPGATDWNIKLWSFSAGGGSNAFSLDMLDKYNGKHLTDTDKDDILAEISDEDGVKPSFKLAASVMAINYKNFCLVIFDGSAAGDFEVPKKAFDLGLYGIRKGETYNFDSEGSGNATGRFTLAYGRPIAKHKFLVLPGNKEVRFREITAGIAVSYINGAAIAEIRESRTTASLVGPDDPGLKGMNFNSRTIFRHGQGGSGLGIDLGFGFVTETDWMFGFAIDNIYGRIKYDKDPEETSVIVDIDNAFFDDYEQDIRDIDDDARENTYGISAFSKSLPIDMRMSLAKKLQGGKYIPNVEIARENTRFRVTGGGQATFGWLRLFAGLGYRTEDVFFSSGFALAFHNFYTDFGLRTRGAVAGNGTKALAFAHSLQFGF
jgi:hypothetical protein